MILFADGRRFQIAGTVLSNGTDIIPFSAIQLGIKPSTFPLATGEVTPPILYVELHIVGEEAVVAAMSVMEYNQLAVSEAARINAQTAPSLLNRVAAQITRTTGCRSCGGR